MQPLSGTHLAGMLAAVGLVAGLASAQDILTIATIPHPEPAAGDEFGAEIAIVGNHICIGAPGRGSGAIYIYDLATYSYIRRIDAPPDALGGAYPFSTAAVGTNALVASDYRTRTVHLWSIPSGTQTRTIVDPDTQTGGFGSVVASNGSLILVSDLFQPSGPNQRTGAVHVYTAAGDFLRTIAHPNQTPGAGGFSSALLISGDTLYGTSIYSRTFPTDGSGEAYAIRLSDGVPLATYPDATNGQNLLGGALAETSNGIAVAPTYDDGFPYGYLYFFQGTSTAPRLTLRSPGLAASGFNDLFGAALAVAADGSLLVGTPRGPHTAPSNLRGQGIVYRYNPTTGAALPSLVPPSTVPTFSYAGTEVVVSGNLVFVGAPSYGFNSPDPGQVFVYRIENPVNSTGFVVR